MRRVLLVLVLALVGLVPALPAQAETPLEYNVVQQMSNRSENRACILREDSWGNACFAFYGDIFWVQDNRADGLSVGVHWRTESGRRGICRNNQGLDIWRWACNKDVPENQWVEFRLGRCDGTKYNCSSLYGWQDWTGWKRVYNSN